MRPLRIKQGSTFRCIFEVQEDDGSPTDMTERRVRMQIRQPPYRPVDVLTLTDDPDDGLTVSSTAEATEIAVYIPANVTATLRPGQSVFDVEIYDPNDPGEVESLFQDGGKIVILPEVVT